MSQFYQLFGGIYEGKLFFQIAEKDGTIKYSFENDVLPEDSTDSLIRAIQDASCEFFNSENFKFDEDFTVINNETCLKRRYGWKVVSKDQPLIKCRSFEEFPWMQVQGFIESYLPFKIENFEIVDVMEIGVWAIPYGILVKKEN